MNITDLKEVRLKIDKIKWDIQFHKNILLTKKEYPKEFIEACLQNNDRECERVRVVRTVKYVLKSIQERWCSSYVMNR